MYTCTFVDTRGSLVSQEAELLFNALSLRALIVRCFVQCAPTPPVGVSVHACRHDWGCCARRLRKTDAASIPLIFQPNTLKHVSTCLEDYPHKRHWPSSAMNSVPLWKGWEKQRWISRSRLKRRGTSLATGHTTARGTSDQLVDVWGEIRRSSCREVERWLPGKCFAGGRSEGGKRRACRWSGARPTGDRTSSIPVCVFNLIAVRWSLIGGYSHLRTSIKKKDTNALLLLFSKWAEEFLQTVCLRKPRQEPV